MCSAIHIVFAIPGESLYSTKANILYCFTNLTPQHKLAFYITHAILNERYG